MAPDYKQILYSIEVHSVEGIQNYFETGGDPNEVHDAVPLFTTMVEMYTRTPRFKECVNVFVRAGLFFDNEALLAVFLDDAEKLKAIISGKPSIVTETNSLFNN